jgi:hypothetical protein
MPIDHIREKARDVSEAAAISPVFINGLSKNDEANQKVIQRLNLSNPFLMLLFQMSSRCGEP